MSERECQTSEPHSSYVGGVGGDNAARCAPVIMKIYVLSGPEYLRTSHMHAMKSARPCAVPNQYQIKPSTALHYKSICILFTVPVVDAPFCVFVWIAVGKVCPNNVVNHTARHTDDTEQTNTHARTQCACARGLAGHQTLSRIRRREVHYKYARDSTCSCV